MNQSNGSKTHAQIDIGDFFCYFLNSGWYVNFFLYHSQTDEQPSQCSLLLVCEILLMVRNLADREGR